MGQKKFVDLNSLRRFKLNQDTANLEKFLGIKATAVASNRVSNALVIKNDSNTQQYDGSTQVSIDITPPKIGTKTEKGILSVGDNLKVRDGAIYLDSESAVNALGETPVYRAKADSDGNTIVDTYVRKENGKALSSSDYTPAEKIKLKGIEEGAQANKIEAISVNGVLQEIYPHKEVRIEVPTKITDLTNDSKFAIMDAQGAVKLAKEAQKLVGDGVKINEVPFNGTVDITIKDNTKIPVGEKGQPNGVATLDGTGKVPASQLPSYVDDVRVATNLDALNALSSEDKKPDIIYITKGDEFTYRYSAELNKFIRVGANVSTSERAMSADKLTNKVHINDKEFDGSKDIVIEHVANSEWANNAKVAKKLSSAVLINGVPFDGATNITIEDNTKLPLEGGTLTGNLTAKQIRAETSFVGNLVGNSTSSDCLSGDFKINGEVFKGNKDITITANPAEVATEEDIRNLFSANG